MDVARVQGYGSRGGPDKELFRDRDLPEPVCWLPAQVGPFRKRRDRVIALRTRHELQDSFAHQLVIEAVGAGAIPMSRLPGRAVWACCRAQGRSWGR